MSAHTPGPWSVEDCTLDLVDEYIGRVKREGCYCGTGDPSDLWCAGHEPERSVFFIEGPRFEEVDELGKYFNEADARLIASAPDLLAAANKARNVIARLAMSVVMGAIVGKDIEAAVNEAQDALNAAIAKAEGAQ